jgi:glutamate 5-kinase
MAQERSLVVVKFGSESLVDGTGIDQQRIDSHAERVARLHEEHDVVVVTSGAVAYAKRRLEQAGRDADGYHDRTLAMMGSAGITVAWEEAFEKAGKEAGQILATYREIHDPKEGQNLASSYAKVRADGVVPVMNYADVLSESHDEHDELAELERKQDNDRYAKDVALHLGATGLVLATGDKEGFMCDGVLQLEVRVADIPAMQRYVITGSKTGTGGMGSKLKMAGEAASAGMAAYICRAEADFVQVLAGRQACTQVVQ